MTHFLMKTTVLFGLHTPLTGKCWLTLLIVSVKVWPIWSSFKSKLLINVQPIEGLYVLVFGFRFCLKFALFCDLQQSHSTKDSPNTMVLMLKFSLKEKHNSGQIKLGYRFMFGGCFPFYYCFYHICVYRSCVSIYYEIR